MLATYDEVMEQMGNDTINLDYAKMLRGRAIAAQAMDNHYASADYWQRYAELKDLLNKQLQESKAHEYAGRFCQRDAPDSRCQAPHRASRYERQRRGHRQWLRQQHYLCTQLQGALCHFPFQFP